MVLLGKEWDYYRQNSHCFWQWEPSVNAKRSPGQDERGARTWLARRTFLQWSWPRFKAIYSLPQLPPVPRCKGGQGEGIFLGKSAERSINFSCLLVKEKKSALHVKYNRGAGCTDNHLLKKNFNRLIAFSVTVTCQRFLSCWEILNPADSFSQVAP